MKPRRLLLTLATTIAALAIPASAQALMITGTAGPTDLTAGAHSDFVVDMNFSGGQIEDLTVGLPPGQAGDPTATPKCSVTDLNADACPMNTEVGKVDVDATVVAAPITANGFLYNLTPQPGEPARFGIVLHPLGIGGLPGTIILQSGAQLRQTDYGLNSIINDISNMTLAPGDTTITHQKLTLYGTRPWMNKPFARNPTSCTPKVVNITANTHADENTFVTGTTSPSFTPTNCGALDFSPKFSAKVTVPGAFVRGQKPTLTTVIEQDPGEAGMSDAVVVVPPSIGPDLSQIVPEGVCPIPVFQASACPANTQIGTANATSPFLTAPLTGPVVLVDNPAGTAKIGLDLHGELNMQIQGQLGLDNSNTFTGLPDIPIGRFELKFNNGPEGLLIANRDLCAPPPSIFHTNFVGYNGATQVGDTAATVEGCVPSNCSKTKAKKKRKHGKGAAVAKKKKKHKKKSCKRKKKKKKQHKKRR